MKDKKETLKHIVKEIKRIADELKIHPYEVTKKQLVANSDITDWMLRNHGSLDLIKKSHFPVTTKELALIREQQDTKLYIATLEKKLADKELYEERLLQTIKNNIKELKFRAPQIIKFDNTKIDRDVVAVMTDHHLGLIVDEKETNEINKFNWQIASRRVAFFVKQIAKYKKEKRDQVRYLHLILLGDMIQGLIHNTKDRNTDLLVHQISGAIHILTHAITTLVQYYPKIKIYCVSGNHSDNVVRREGNRIINHKYDSYEHLIYYALSVALRQYKNIEFIIPESPILSINVPNGRIIATHGDTIFSGTIGNPGKNINTKKVGDDIRKFNTGEISRGKEAAKMIIVGHHHSFARFLTEDKTEVVMVPSLCGVDNYAFSLTINSNVAAQFIFESTKDFIIGDNRLIHLDIADNDSTLDSIIPTYNYELKWSK